MPPIWFACICCPNVCISSFVFMYASKNLAVQRSRQTDSPLLISPSR